MRNSRKHKQVQTCIYPVQISWENKMKLFEVLCSECKLK